MHRSSHRSLRSLLRRQALTPFGGITRTVESRQVHVIDGDTIRTGAERVRIRGLDAPELTEPGGQEAQERLRQLLGDGTIRIVPYGKDSYDRSVADVFVNGRNVAEVLNQESYETPR
jgi:micrococcal nuclease